MKSPGFFIYAIPVIQLIPVSCKFDIMMIRNSAPGTNLPMDMLNWVSIITPDKTEAVPFQYPDCKVLWPVTGMVSSFISVNQYSI
jgi:hypothetical protein